MFAGVGEPFLDRSARARLHWALDALREHTDVAARLAADPVSALHRYADPREQELVGLLASSVAFGNAKAFGAKLDDALRRLGPSVVGAADEEQRLFESLRGFRHRLYRGEDLGRLLLGGRRVQRRYGSLGACFAEQLARAGSDLRQALSAFVAEIKSEGGFAAARSRGAAHLLAEPAKSSGCKRLLLYLRWMVRKADGVDLGLWSVDPSILIIPVDTHVHKLARNLGMTRRASPSWKTAEEITEVLRGFDPADPVKYDFALCHLGMLQRCPSKRDPTRCEGCGVKPVCIHWRRRPNGAGGPSKVAKRARSA